MEIYNKKTNTIDYFLTSLSILLKNLFFVKGVFIWRNKHFGKNSRKAQQISVNLAYMKVLFYTTQ